MAASDVAMVPGLMATLKRYMPGSDIGLAVGIVVLLSVLVLPLPPFLLDMGLAVSLTASVLVLMVAIFLVRPLDFTSFPTLLLLTTLLRLSLNVATTRLILSHGSEGPTSAGLVVAAFGGFLMGGDVVIGIILFGILLVVNFMVITKGSGRIAEVAARFSLDAMPGKQMAIDAELSAGMVDEKTARRRRRELEEESGFYGAMDGCGEVRARRRDRQPADHVHQHPGRPDHRRAAPRHGIRRRHQHIHHAHRGRRAGLADPGPARLHRRRHREVTKGGMEGTADAALVRQLGGGPKAARHGGQRSGIAGADARLADACRSLASPVSPAPARGCATSILSAPSTPSRRHRRRPRSRRSRTRCGWT